MALLDTPPPSPQLAQAQQPSFAGLTGGGAGGPGGAPGGPGGLGADAMMPDVGALISLGQQLDESLLLLAQAAPAGAPEISQARELIKSALAKTLAETGGPSPGASPVEPGTQFPGSAIGRGQP